MDKQPRIIADSLALIDEALATNALSEDPQTTAPSTEAFQTPTSTSIVNFAANAGGSALRWTSQRGQQ